MRPWRKLHSGIISSDRLSLCSDSAALLFDLLVVAQDDEGKYPWTPAKIKALTVSRSWSPQKTGALSAELLRAGLVLFLREEGKTEFIAICGGADKNGKPAGYHETFLYEASETSSTGLAQNISAGVHTSSPPDEIREDEIREEKDKRESSSAAATRPKGLFDEQWARSYALKEKGWDEVRCTREIKKFLGNHEAKGWKGITDQNASWTFWVHHSDDFRPPPGNGHSRPGTGLADSDPETRQAILRNIKGPGYTQLPVKAS